MKYQIAVHIMEKNSSNAWAWIPSYTRTWDDDYVLIGHAAKPFVLRGGFCNDRAGAGVFYSGITNGSPGNGSSFRPVLAF